MLICPGDLDIAARTVWGEARGEYYEGKKAVAHVLINRWQSTTGQWAKDDTLASACLRHLQYSAWNKGDPNFEKMFQISETSDTFLECRQAVLEALSEYRRGVDPTGGARHYHSVGIEPYWAKGKSGRAIGQHVFYSGIN